MRDGTEYLEYLDKPASEAPDEELVDLFGDCTYRYEMGYISTERFEEVRAEIIKRIKNKNKKGEKAWN